MLNLNTSLGTPCTLYHYQTLFSSAVNPLIPWRVTLMISEKPHHDDDISMFGMLQTTQPISILVCGQHNINRGNYIAGPVVH